MPASTNGGGTTFVIPDICLVPAPPGPPVPTPFPNTSDLSTADGVVDKVLFDSKEVVVESSTLPQSQGDEGGIQMGQQSGTIMDQVSFKAYSSKVLVDGKKVVHSLVPTAHNGTSANAPSGGMQVAPSQVKVLVSM